MTLKQRLVVALLALADVAVIAGLLALMTRPAGSSATPPPSPAPATPPLSTRVFDRYAAGADALKRDCAWRAARLMAYTGLGGTVQWAPGGELRFEITHPLTANQPTEEAAQAAWTAFDVALALQDVECCASFSDVSVAIMAQGGQEQAEIAIRASAADLAAYGAGTLDEAAFIARVAYSASDRSTP